MKIDAHCLTFEHFWTFCSSCSILHTLSLEQTTKSLFKMQHSESLRTVQYRCKVDDSGWMQCCEIWPKNGSLASHKSFKLEFTKARRATHRCTWAQWTSKNQLTTNQHPRLLSALKSCNAYGFPKTRGSGQLKEGVILIHQRILHKASQWTTCLSQYVSSSWIFPATLPLPLPPVYHVTYIVHFPTPQFAQNLSDSKRFSHSKSYRNEPRKVDPRRELHTNVLCISSFQL